jgi:predicted TIM-barrel fold metal-dependent hydrolase
LSEPIIDSHHHIWRLADVPWLAGPPVPRIFGEYGPLRRDYLIDDFISDATPHGVIKSVYAQINVAGGREVDEVAWVQSNASRRGFPHAISGYADLASPEVGAVLDRELAAGNLRAIRQQLHWHEKPLYRFAGRPDLMNDKAWRRGMSELARRGLAFELQVFAAQMVDAARLASDFPNMQFILLHAGMLEDRSDAGWTAWRAGMRGLAACPNVAVKLSGLGTFEHACSVALWRPVIEETLTLFGSTRALFGSNFPIEKLWTSYGQLVDVMLECLSRLNATERQAVLHDNAARIYKL